MQAIVPAIIQDTAVDSLFYNCGGACVESMTTGNFPIVPALTLKKGTVVVFDPVDGFFKPFQAADLPFAAGAIVGILSQDVVKAAGQPASGAIVTHNANYALSGLIFDVAITAPQKAEAIIYMHSAGLKGIPNGLAAI